MFKNISHILTGWGKRYGLISTSTAEQKLSELRMKKCSVCIHAHESKALKLLNGNVHHETTLYCTKCGCPCLQKTLVADETCPLNKW